MQNTLQENNKDIILTLPDGHERQKALDVAPMVDENVPGGQELQEVAESAPIAVENLPTMQLTQVDIDIAPILLLYFPASHESQPDEILYRTVHNYNNENSLYLLH